MEETKSKKEELTLPQLPREKTTASGDVDTRETVV